MMPFPFFDPSQTSYPICAGALAKAANPANPYPEKLKISTISMISNEAGNENNVLNFIDTIEERAAIMEFDAADCYQTREQATAAAYENCKIIFLARYRLDLNKKGTST